VATDAAYDRFLLDGHVAALTLFAFIPALIIANVLPLLPGFRPGEPREALPGLVTTAILAAYGAGCLILGRKSVRPVLQGRLNWPRFLVVVVAAFLLNVSLFLLTHTAVHFRSVVAFDGYFVLLFFLLAVLSPVSEEICFQGYLQSRLRRWGVLPAMLCTTVLFVGIHVPALAHVPQPAEVVRLFEVYFPPLLVFALVRQYTGSLLAAITVHVLNNATILFTAAAAR
jgi:membrane protease YdiL (CAAX protease family)